MTFTITSDDIINYAKTHFNITNKLELSHLLARLDVESGGFKRLSESLNYSPEGLLATWPNRFTKETANKLGRTKEHPADQVAIANLVYGTRMGNELDGTNDNDGYDFRGGGLTQLTGEGMYKKFLNWGINNKYLAPTTTMDEIDDYVRTKDGALLSAMWFWVDHNCSKYALNDDVTGVCKTINGGTNGLKEQKVALLKYKKLLGV